MCYSISWNGGRLTRNLEEKVVLGMRCVFNLISFFFFHSILLFNYEIQFKDNNTVILGIRPPIGFHKIKNTLYTDYSTTTSCRKSRATPLKSRCAWCVTPNRQTPTQRYIFFEELYRRQRNSHTTTRRRERSSRTRTSSSKR